MERNKVAWWEEFDYGLTEPEQKEVKRLTLILSQKVKDLKKNRNMDLLKAAKKLGDIIHYKPNL